MRNLRLSYRVIGAIIAALAAGLASMGDVSLAQDGKVFRIGTGPTGSTDFAIGTLIGSVVSSPPGARDCERGGSCGVPGLIAISTSTAGSIANVAAIASRQLESGLCQADVAYWAFHGAGPYRGQGAVGNLRAIAQLYPESVHVAVWADSGIRDVAELRGRRVAIGQQESGSVASALAILQAFGLSESDLRLQYLDGAQASDALREGKIDAFLHIAAAPDPTIQELTEASDIALLPIAGPPAESLRASYPFFTAGVVGGDAYRGIKETPTLKLATLWVVGAEVEERVVHGLTRALFHPNNRRALDASQPFGRHIRPERALDGVTLQLHPGAALYYFEAGLMR